MILGNFKNAFRQAKTFASFCQFYKDHHCFLFDFGVTTGRRTGKPYFRFTQRINAKIFFSAFRNYAGFNSFRINCFQVFEKLHLSNYIGQTRRNLKTRINEHKFDQRSEVCKHLLANTTQRFNFKQLEILGSIVGQKELHLIESHLKQQHQPELNVDG